MTPVEAKAFRSFDQFKNIRTQPYGAGYEDQPADKVFLPDFEALDVGEEVNTIDPKKPFEEWNFEAQYDAYSLPHISQRAQFHGLSERSRFNGMIGTLDHWNSENQYFEARLERTQAVIRVGIENVQVIDEKAPQHDPRHNLQVGRDEGVRLVGKQMFRQT